MNQENPAIVSTTTDHVTWLRMNRPKSMNAINPEMLEGLNSCLDGIASNDDTRALVLTGEGRAFCAGVDLGHALKQAEGGWEPVAALLEDVSRTFERIANLRIPVIAAVNGIAVAGGLELVLCCDLVVASKSAGFGDGHANYGLLPGGGSSVRLARKIGPTRAKEMLFTGETLSAYEMQQAGLVNKVSDDAVLIETAQTLAKKIAAKSRSGIQHMKRLVDEGLQQSVEAALKMEHLAFQAHCTSPDFREGLMAFQEKRAPRFNQRLPGDLR